MSAFSLTTRETKPIGHDLPRIATESLASVIVLEDDEDLRETLLHALSSTSYRVTGVANLKQFHEKVALCHYDLAVVDVSLPDGSGLSAVRSLRQSTTTKIIVLTGRDTIVDRVEGYSSGADVYMVKPTSQAELHAAIKSLLSRATAEQPSSSTAGWSLTSTDGCLHSPGGKQIKLTHRQFEFMKRLMREPRKAVPRDELREVIELSQSGAASRALDMFVVRLRRDIEDQGGYEAPIETVPRLGFAFRPS